MYLFIFGREDTEEMDDKTGAWFIPIIFFCCAALGFPGIPLSMYNHCEPEAQIQGLETLVMSILTIVQRANLLISSLILFSLPCSHVWASSNNIYEIPEYPYYLFWKKEFLLPALLFPQIVKNSRYRFEIAHSNLQFQSQLEQLGITEWIISSVSVEINAVGFLKWNAKSCASSTSCTRLMSPCT